jgi:hypothetical protein
MIAKDVVYRTAADDPVEVLSSKLTFFYKFVFPSIWVGGFALSTLALFLSPAVENNEDIPAMRWAFLAVTLVGAELLYWLCGRVKRVSLAEHEFVISNYRRTIRVPVRDVERVTSSIFMNPQLIWIHFRRPTEFGNRVVFMPEQRLFGSYTRHPLAKRLNELLRDTSMS